MDNFELFYIHLTESEQEDELLEYFAKVMTMFSLTSDEVRNRFVMLLSALEKGMGKDEESSSMA